MKIAIRKEPDGLIYIDKNLREDIPYTEPPYNFTIIEIEKDDCVAEDFNDDLTFNLDKYNARTARKRSRNHQFSNTNKLYFTYN